jgi:hypothetical protein
MAQRGTVNPPLTPEPKSSSRSRLRAWRNSQSEKDEYGLIDPKDIPVVKPPDTLPELGLRHSCDLVHHQAARQMQAIVLVRLYEQSNEKGVLNQGGGVFR